MIDMASATPSGGLTAGNTLVVMVASGTNTVTIKSIQDQRGSAYARRAGTLTTGAMVELWVAPQIAAGTGTQITITLSASATSVCSAAQYSGVGWPGGWNQTSGTTLNPTVSYTTVDTNNWVVAAFAVNNGTAFTAASGTNLRQSPALSGAPVVAGALVDRSSASAAAVTPGVTHAAGNWVATAVELRSVAVDQIHFTRTGGLTTVQFTGTTFTNWVNMNCSCSQIVGSALVDDGAGHFYISGNDGKLYQHSMFGGVSQKNVAVTPTTTVTLGDPSFDSVLNRVYVGTSDGHVYAVSTPF